jgi:hypothetical protein
MPLAGIDICFLIFFREIQPSKLAVISSIRCEASKRRSEAETPVSFFRSRALRDKGKVTGADFLAGIILES